MMRGKYPDLALMFHVPNGGRRDKREAALMAAEGVRAGVPDIVLAAPSGQYHGLFIELKRRKGGKVSPAQMAWIDALNRRGYAAVVCHGFDEAIDTIKKYLDLKGE